MGLLRGCLLIYRQALDPWDVIKMVKEGRRPITLPIHERRAYSIGFEAALRCEAGQ